MPALSRPGAPPPTAGSGVRPGTPPVPQHAPNSARNVRRPSTPPAERSSTLRPREPEFDEQAALQEARDLLATRNWGSARQALQTLASRVPQSRHYRALLCYARGREAHASGRVDEAALEYQRALQLEPELGLAKQALGELQARRR
jgi:tetratricopeptide (TPR) repeat protein